MNESRDRSKEIRVRGSQQQVRMGGGRPGIIKYSRSASSLSKTPMYSEAGGRGRVSFSRQDSKKVCVGGHHEMIPVPSFPVLPPPWLY